MKKLLTFQNICAIIYMEVNATGAKSIVFDFRGTGTVKDLTFANVKSLTVFHMPIDI